MPTPHYKQCKFNAFVTKGVGAIMITINRASPTGSFGGRNTYNNDDLKFTQAATDTISFDSHHLLLHQDDFTIEKIKQENGLILTTDLSQIALDSPFIVKGVVNGSPVNYDLTSELLTLWEWFLYDDEAKYRIRVCRQMPDNSFTFPFIGDFRRKDFRFSNKGITHSPESATEFSRKQVTIHAGSLVAALKDVRVQDLTWSISDMQDTDQTPFYTGMRVNTWSAQLPNGDPNPAGVAFHQELVDYATGLNPQFNKAQGAKASAHLFFDETNFISDGETETIDGKTYTWQTTLTNVDGHVQLGAGGDPVLSIINLLYAINATPNQSGIAYAAATTKHPTVECDPSQVSILGTSLNALYVKAIYGGLPGNSIAVANTSQACFWNAATLTGGSDVPTFDPPTFATFGIDVVHLNYAAYVLGKGYRPPVFPGGSRGIFLNRIFTKIFSHPDIDFTFVGADPTPIKKFSQLWSGSGWEIDESEPVNSLGDEYCSWNGLFGLDPNVSLRIDTASNTTPIVVTLLDFNPPYLSSFEPVINDGDTIVIYDVTGNDGALGTWTAKITDTTHPEQITLVGSIGTGAGTGGIMGKVMSTPVTYSPDGLLFDVIRDFLLQEGYTAECGATVDGDPSVYLRDRRSVNGVSIPASFADHVVGDTRNTTEEEFIPAPVLTLQYRGDDDKIVVDHLPLPTDTQINLTIPLRTHAFADVNGNVYGRHLMYNMKLPIDQQIQAQPQTISAYGLANVPNGWLPFAFLYRNFATNTEGERVFPPAQPSQGVLASPNWVGNFALGIVQNKDDSSERTKKGFNYGEGIIYTLAQFYANALNIRPVRQVTRTYNKLTDDSNSIEWIKPGVADSFWWNGEVRNWEAIKTSVNLKRNTVTITYVEQPDYTTLQEYKIITLSASNSSGGASSSSTDGGSGGATTNTTNTTTVTVADDSLNAKNTFTNSTGSPADNTLTSFFIPTGTTVEIDCKCIGRVLSGSGATAGDSINYRLQGTFKNISGTVTRIGDDIVTPNGQDVATMNIHFNPNSPNVDLVVTNPANTVMLWKSKAWLLTC